MEDLPPDAQSLTPLPDYMRNGLIAVTVLGMISTVSAFFLFLTLAYRIYVWQKKGNFRHNQFILLICNLLISNVFQSLSFVVNAEWLVKDMIDIDSRTCFVQGWFIATGDVANGLGCMLIAVHTLLSVGWNINFSTRALYLSVLGCWIFKVLLALIPVMANPHRVYALSNVWCWIPANHSELRFWSHYLWAYITDFGTILIYIMTILLIRGKDHRREYSPGEKRRVARTVEVTIVYPIVFIICNLPLVSSRMAGVAGHPPTNIQVIAVGAMITCNGWFNVLLYVYTQRQTFFTSKLPEHVCDFNVLSIPFLGYASTRFGNKTTVEAGPALPIANNTSSRKIFHKDNNPYGTNVSKNSNDSGDVLVHVDDQYVRTETTVQVHSELAQPADVYHLDIYGSNRAASRPTALDRLSSDENDSKSFSS